MAVLGALVASSVAWSGCSGKKQSEYVAGFSTQAHVPRDLQSIIIRVDSLGQTYFEGDYPVYDGTVRLPKTFGIYKDAVPKDQPITVTVVGFNVNDVNGAGANSAYTAFNTAATQMPTVGGDPGSGGGARILRAAKLQYVEDQILFLPMPLHYSCFDVDCSKANCGADNCTCKAGQCVPPDVDNSTLPPYADDLIYGSTNTCFRPFSNKDADGNTRPGCLDWGLAPQVIDADNCIFALPGTPSVPADAGVYDPTGLLGPYIQAADQGGGLNVRAVFDNVVSEVLDYEGSCTSTAQTGATTDGGVTTGPQEGYCVYPDAPQKFMLAPGLCQMYKQASSVAVGSAPHVMTLLEASAACPPKTAYQPICDDSIQGPPQPTLADGGSTDSAFCGTSFALQPAPSALYVLFDRSSGMRSFLGNSAAANALGLSLQDPVFKQTLVGLKFPPAAQSDCTTSSFATALDVPFEPSLTAQADIATKLEAAGADSGVPFPSGSAPWYLEAALQGAYDALRALPNSKQMNRRAVMLFYDRDFNTAPPDCTATHLDAISESAAAAAATDPTTRIETYVVYLANQDYPDGGVPGNPEGNGARLANGLANGGKYFFNANSTEGNNAAATELEALGDIVADMGSCVYEPSIRGVGPSPTPIPPDWTITFADRVANNAVVSVPNAPNCLTDDGNLTPAWVYDNQHIRLCENTCKRLVASIFRDEQIAAVLHPDAAAGGVIVAAVPPAYLCDGGVPLTDAAVIESGTSAPEDAGPPPALDAATDAGFGGGDAGSPIADSAVGG